MRIHESPPEPAQPPNVKVIATTAVSDFLQPGAMGLESPYRRLISLSYQGNVHIAAHQGVTGVENTVYTMTEVMAKGLGWFIDTRLKYFDPERATAKDVQSGRIHSSYELALRMQGKPTSGHA